MNKIKTKIKTCCIFFFLRSISFMSFLKCGCIDVKVVLSNFLQF